MQKKIIIITAATVCLLAVLLCAIILIDTKEGGSTLRYVDERYIVDDAKIASGDVDSIIHPVWVTVNINDGEDEYVASKEPFTQEQYLLAAVWWYLSEVGNGGHHQFYWNSTGIVYEDALSGLQLIGAEKSSAVLLASAKLIGSEPDKDRNKRQKQLDAVELEDFNTVDNEFYKNNCEGEIVTNMADYMKRNPEQFYFDGVVPVLK